MTAESAGHSGVPLRLEVPWELPLPARKRADAVIGRLIASARRAVV